MGCAGLVNSIKSIIDYIEGAWDGPVSGVSQAAKTEVNTKEKVVAIYDKGQDFVMVLHYTDIVRIDGYDVFVGQWKVVKGDMTTPGTIGETMHGAYGFMVFKEGVDGAIQTAISKAYAKPINVAKMSVADIDEAFRLHPLTSLSRD